MFNPDGTLTMSAAYNVGDFWYGKNGYDMKDNVFRTTTDLLPSSFLTSSGLKWFYFQNSEDNETRRQVPVPYSNSVGVIAYVGTTTNDLRKTHDRTQYIATNLYSEYENTFNNTHYLKVLVGYNFEQSTWQRTRVQRNGLILKTLRIWSCSRAININSRRVDKWNFLVALEE